MPDSPSLHTAEASLEVVRPSRDVAVPRTGEAAVRGSRSLVDSPPHDLAAADELLLRIGRLQAAAEPLFASIEEATGLRRGSIFALQAVKAGHHHPRAIAREVGVDTASSQKTVDRLRDGGFLQPAPPRPGDRHVELTRAGRTVLEHVEGMTLRSTDALLQLIGPDRARDVVRTLEVLVDALTGSTAAARHALTGGLEAVPGSPIALPAGGPDGPPTSPPTTAAPR